jgi:predicted nuclease of predicted toxin-antitoxin system
MAHLYSNENFPLPVVQELRNLGHDVLTVREAGNADQAIPDDEVLAFATAESRVILTFNRRDFIHLHNAQPNHAGIIVCTYDADFIEQAQRIHKAIEAEPTLDGTLLRVNRPAK